MNEGCDDGLAGPLTEIARLVDEHADWAYQHRRPHPAVLAACIERGLFKWWAPAAYGGAEADLPGSLALFEQAARLDGSFGFTLTIGVGGGLFGAYLPPEAAGEIFGPANAVIAGSGAVGGTADAVNAGFLARGRWCWASGAHHATTFTANCAVAHDGRPLVGVDGQPVVRAMAFAPSDVDIVDSWDWPGLRGTDSHDIVVTHAAVPAARTFTLLEPAGHDGPLYRYPFQSIAEVSFAAVAVGIARHAIDEFAALAHTKSARGGGRLADTAEAHEVVGDAEAVLRSARSFLVDAVNASWATTIAGDPLTPDTVTLVRLAAAHATRAAAHAVDRCYQLAGMSPLARRSRLGRAWLDIHTITQHAAVARRNLFGAGSDLLGAQAPADSSTRRRGPRPAVAAHPSRAADQHQRRSAARSR